MGCESGEPGLRDSVSLKCSNSRPSPPSSGGSLHCQLSRSLPSPAPALCSLTYPPSIQRLGPCRQSGRLTTPILPSKKKNLITVATIRIRSGLNAPIDNHSWDCISKRKPAKSGLVDSQRPWKTHRLSLRLLSIAQKERGRAGLWVISSKQCAVERYL